MTTLEFRWTVSRGRDTYGYNVCSLYVDGTKVAACNGGGYDMEGTCLGTFIARNYGERLRGLKLDDMPGQSHWESNHRRVCRGECHEKYILDLVNGNPPADMPDYDRDVDTCPVCGGDTGYADLGHRVDDGRYFYGLRFIDPNYDPRKATLARSDELFTTADDVGKSLGELQQAGKIVDLEIIRAAYKETSPCATERHTLPSIDGACGKSSVETIAKAIGLSFQYVPTRSKKVTIYTLIDSRA